MSGAQRSESGVIWFWSACDKCGAVSAGQDPRMRADVARCYFSRCLGAMRVPADQDAADVAYKVGGYDAVTPMCVNPVPKDWQCRFVGRNR